MCLLPLAVTTAAYVGGILSRADVTAHCDAAGTGLLATDGIADMKIAMK
jgi:hypothetical protein